MNLNARYSVRAVPYGEKLAKISNFHAIWDPRRPADPDDFYASVSNPHPTLQTKWAPCYPLPTAQSTQAGHFPALLCSAAEETFLLEARSAVAPLLSSRQ